MAAAEANGIAAAWVYLGTLLLLFLIMHIYHFWTPSRLGGMWNIRKHCGN